MAEKCYFHSDANGHIIEPVMVGGTRICNPKLVEITNYGFMDSHTDVVIRGELCSESAGNNQGNIFEPRFTWTITRLIFSGPMTMVFWDDGTRTKVRLAAGSYDDRANAIRWAMAKKYYGSRAQLEKRLGASRKFGDMWDDNTGVYTILMSLFDDPKKLDEYVNDALKIAENYNER